MRQDIVALNNLRYCNQAISLKKNIEMNFIMLGEKLMKIRDDKLYLGQWTAFHEYLDEMAISEAMASKLINIYKTFVLQYLIPADRIVDAGGWTKLNIIIPLVSSKEDAEYWIEKSLVLSSKDLAKEVKEKKTGVEMSKCKHHETYTIRICRDCGERWEVFEN